MATFSRSVEIRASPIRVWGIISDVERWHEWTPSITRVTWLDDGPSGVGRRARVVQPRLAPGVFVVTSWDPERGFDWVTRHPGVTGCARHVIEETAGGSRVTLSVSFSGFLSPIVAWLYGSLTEKYLQMEAEGVKRRAEGETAVPE